MNFTKMEGAGNDYVYIDATRNLIDDPKALAIKLSDRHFGIGSDGVIYIRKSENGLYFMDLYNSDGSRAKMCGNGIRCVAKYLYDHKMVNDTSLDIDTPSGIKHIELVLSDDKVVGASVSMGKPLEIKEIEVNINGINVSGTFVNMGNPHFVVICDPDEFINYGNEFQTLKEFPGGVNVEFVQILNRDNVRMRVFERGSGETMACGTGCTAVAVALVNKKLTENKLTVKCLGGDIIINYNGPDNEVIMTGPAKTVFEGEINL